VYEDSGELPTPAWFTPSSLPSFSIVNILKCV
jgi:hypothetical protein